MASCAKWLAAPYSKLCCMASRNAWQALSPGKLRCMAPCAEGLDTAKE